MSRERTGTSVDSPRERGHGPARWSTARLLALGLLALASGCRDSTTPTPRVVFEVVALPFAVVGGPYRQELTASGGTGNFTWSITSGTLPTGLTMASDGTISGTPSSPGSSSFTARAISGDQSASRTLEITVLAPVAVVQPSWPDARTGTPYRQTLEASGGDGVYRWSLSGGTLPVGLSLDTAGVLSGTPLGAGTADVSVRVESGGLDATGDVRITVVDPLIVTNGPLAPATVGVGYGEQLAAAGGDGEYTWSMAGGELPDGLALDADGVVSGTPVAAGTSSFDVQVASGEESAVETLQITVFDLLEITTSALSMATTDAPYAEELTAVGGTGSYGWAVVEGELPGGLTLDEKGVISGVPTAPGTSSFIVEVSSGTQRARRTFELTTADSLVLTTQVLATGITGTPYEQLLSASGGTGAYTWTVTAGSLPRGLTLEEAGRISGTPTSAGVSTVTLEVRSGGREARREFELAVADPLVVTTETLPPGIPGEGYAQDLAAAGGTGTYLWSLASGELPDGLSLDASGSISGTPTSTGEASFRVRVTSGEQTATSELRLSIVEPVGITTVTLSDGRVGEPYADTVRATGGTGTYTFEVVTGRLAPGTTLDPSNGVISGTPVESGTFDFTVEASSGGWSGSRPLTLAVNATECSLDSAPDTDGDRLPDCVETGSGRYRGITNTGTDPNVPDTDQDGIPDGDEVLGTLGGLDLPAMGANPLRRNILIEYDWFADAQGSAHDHRPSASTIAKVAAAFAAAPVSNPDGSSGIVAIQDYGQGGAFTGGNLVPDVDGCIVGGVGGMEYRNHLNDNFGSERAGYFHYSLVIHRYNATSADDCAGSSASSGQAFYNDFRSLVSSGSFHNNPGSGDQWVANTILHEVGHNLNLTHGGSWSNSFNHKPNYPSVMNYRYQFPGIDVDCDVVADGVLDYSRGTRITLDEASVDEAVGVCGDSPIDWNRDGDVVDSGFSLDLQGYRSGGSNGSAADVLEDHDDWAHIALATSIAGAGLPGGMSLVGEIESCMDAPALPGGG